MQTEKYQPSSQRPMPEIRVSGTIRWLEGWDFSVCIGDRWWILFVQTNHLSNLFVFTRCFYADNGKFNKSLENAKLKLQSIFSNGGGWQKLHLRDDWWLPAIFTQQACGIA